MVCSNWVGYISNRYRLFGDIQLKILWFSVHDKTIIYNNSHLLAGYWVCHIFWREWWDRVPPVRGPIKAHLMRNQNWRNSELNFLRVQTRILIKNTPCMLQWNMEEIVIYSSFNHFRQFRCLRDQYGTWLWNQNIWLYGENCKW